MGGPNPGGNAEKKLGRQSLLDAPLGSPQNATLKGTNIRFFTGYPACQANFAVLEKIQ
jgi:hypothetical protein